MGEGVGNWDGHRFLKKQYDIHGPILDQPAAALLDATSSSAACSSETLVVWCTEFGRMPTFQKGASGRDHNPHGFTAWLAGAGVKRAFSLRRDRRIRLQGGRRRLLRARPARDDPLAPGPRPQAADLLPQRHRAPPDRRARPRPHRRAGIKEKPRCHRLSTLITTSTAAFLSAALLLLFDLGAATVSAGDLPWPCRNGPFQNGSATERDARGVPIEWDEAERQEHRLEGRPGRFGPFDPGDRRWPVLVYRRHRRRQTAVCVRDRCAHRPHRSSQTPV